MPLSPRQTTLLLATAALYAIGANQSVASLSIDVRAFSKNGSTAAIANPKLVQVAAGDTIVFRVFADVTGHNDAKFQCLQSLSGSFLSIGSLLGDLVVPPSGITAPFNANASAGGQQIDLDGDGDLDIGSNNPADPEGFFAVRANLITGPHSVDYLGNTVFPPGAEPTPIPHGTEYRIATTLRMIVTGGSGSTLVNFRSRPSMTGGYWAEDAEEFTIEEEGTFYGYTGGTSFTDTSNIQGSGVVLAVPEPTSLGLTALASLGLLARRRGGAS